MPLASSAPANGFLLVNEGVRGLRPRLRLESVRSVLQRVGRPPRDVGASLPRGGQRRDPHRMDDHGRFDAELTVLNVDCIVALARTEGNVPEAARLLGIGRATLYRKLEDYGIAR